jgi:hypothetical protein
MKGECDKTIALDLTIAFRSVRYVQEPLELCYQDSAVTVISAIARRA